jgi:hypothetical protein
LTNKEAGINPNKKDGSLNVTKGTVLSLDQGNNNLKEQLVKCRQESRAYEEKKQNLMVEVRQK